LELEKIRFEVPEEGLSTVDGRQWTI